MSHPDLKPYFAALGLPEQYVAPHTRKLILPSKPSAWLASENTVKQLALLLTEFSVNPFDGLDTNALLDIAADPYAPAHAEEIIIAARAALDSGDRRRLGLTSILKELT